MCPLFGLVLCKTKEISLNALVNNLRFPIYLWMIGRTTFQQSSLQAEELGPEKAHKHLVTIYHNRVRNSMQKEYFLSED